MKQVLITGTNGLLGMNLVHELLTQGYAVKGLVRNPDQYRGLRHPRLQLVRGSLEDDLSPLLADCQAVIHVAAETRQDLTDYAAYARTNVQGTLRLLEAAIACRLEKFVFVSTANTMGYAEPGGGGEETSPMKEPYLQSFYARSKREAEEKLLTFTDRISLVIANPTFMLGAFDSRPSSGKLILMVLGKRLIVYPPGGKNLVHVGDVAQGLIRCLERGRNGERYLLAGENWSYRAFFSRLGQLTGQNSWLVPIPAFGLRALGWLGDLLRKLGVRTELSRVNMRILGVFNYYQHRKSVQELGLTYRPVDEAITEAIAYFSNQSIPERYKPLYEATAAPLHHT